MAEGQIQDQHPHTQDQISTHRLAVIQVLTNHHDELEEMGVRYLAVFGSVARDEAGAASDIDILIDLERPAGLLRYAHVENYLEGLLERKVDLVPYDSVRRELQDRIFREAVRVF